MSRRAKRERLVAREYDEHVINSAESAQLASTEDADLFTIDRAGSKSKKRKIEKLGKQSELKKDILVVLVLIKILLREMRSERMKRLAPLRHARHCFEEAREI